MKTNKVYALTLSTRPGGLLNSRLFVVALILALLLASLPPASALAAPASKDQPWTGVDLEREWKNKLQHLNQEGLFFNQVRFYPADFEESSDLTQAWDLLHKHGSALRLANTVVLNHSGFDFKGDVINERQAYETVHDLAMYLGMMRSLRLKIAEAGYKIHRVR